MDKEKEVKKIFNKRSNMFQNTYINKLHGRSAAFYFAIYLNVL